MNVFDGTVRTDVGASDGCSIRFIWVLRGLCLVGLGVSTYLAWTAFHMSEVFGCGGGEIIDCNHVLHSRWSKVFGIPVSVPAAALYSSLLVMLTFAGRPAPLKLRQYLWGGLTLGALMAGLAALWFIGLQVFALGHICPYCIAVHSCGILLAAMLLQNRMLTSRQKGLTAGISLMSVAVLVATQSLTPEQAHFEIVYHEDEEGWTADDDLADSDFFAAPGDVFDAPGGDVTVKGQVSESGPNDTDISGASRDRSRPVHDAAASDKTTPVVSTLLTILPPRLNWNLLSIQLLSIPNDEAANAAENTGEGAADADAVTSKVDVEKPVVPERKLLTVAGNRVTLDVRQWPVLGSPEAPMVFVEMFDYTCPHCRNTHHVIKGVMDQYGDRLAILALPVPLERACNDAASGGGHQGACELAKIAVAVWRTDATKFREFHDWMFERNRSVSEARSHAEKLVGAEQFRSEFATSIPSDYVKRHVELYKKVGRGSVPKLLFPKSTINGEVNSRTTLTSTIERELAVRVDK